MRDTVNIECKGMRKTFFSVFLCFAKDETDFLPYSNIDSKKYSGSVLAKISRNKYGNKCETRIHENGSKILEFTKMARIHENTRSTEPLIVIFVQKMWPPSIGRCVLRLKTDVLRLKSSFLSIGRRQSA